MANKYKGTSYDTLKSYLDSIDVDTSNMDNDTLDSQYLQRLRKRNGEALSTREQREGNITLTQYLSDADAERTKNENIALAENNARQETAYNDYVNSKLAKYLNIAEENNGTAGYTGITEGNRIALANQEKNIASNIQNTKQNAISDYLKQYNNTLASNSQYALDQMTEMQSTFDQNEMDRQDKTMDRAKYLLEYSVIPSIQKYSDGTLNVSEANKIINYINSLNIPETNKQELLNEVNSSYTFSDGKNNKTTLTLSSGQQSDTPSDTPSVTPPVTPPVTSGTRLLNADGTESNFYERLKETEGKKKVIDFTLDGEQYQVRTYGRNLSRLSIEDINRNLSNRMSKQFGDNWGAAKQFLQDMKTGEAVAFYTATPSDYKSDAPYRYVIVKMGEDDYAMIGKDDTFNVGNNSRRKGFLKIYQYYENKGLVLNDLLNK